MRLDVQSMELNKKSGRKIQTSKNFPKMKAIDLGFPDGINTGFTIADSSC